MKPSVVMGWVTVEFAVGATVVCRPAALPASCLEAVSEEEGAVNRLQEHHSGASSFVKEILEGGEPVSIEKTLCKITSSMSNRERLRNGWA